MAEAAQQPGAVVSSKHLALRDARTLAWLERHVATRFGIEPARLELSFPPLGQRTPVAFARWGTDDAVVLKLFPSVSKFVSSAFHVRYLHALGLPVPAPHGWSLRSRMARPHAFLSIEQQVPGQTIDRIPEGERRQALANAARALSAFHAHTRRWRGWIGIPRPGAYASSYWRLVHQRVRELSPYAPREVLRRLAAELRRAGGAVGARPAYELIHGHVNAGNLLIGESGAFMLDLGAVHYGDAARDIVRALHRLCATPDEAKLLLDQYLADAGPGAAVHLERAEPFYACDYLVRLTRKQLDRRRREQQASDAELHEIAERRLELCFELLRPGGPRFPEVWSRL